MIEYLLLCFIYINVVSILVQNMKRNLFLLFLLALLVFVIVLSRSENQLLSRVFVKEKTKKTILVEVERLELNELVEDFSFLTEIKSHFSTNIVSEMAGILKKIYVLNSRLVQENELLFELENEDEKLTLYETQLQYDEQLRIYNDFLALFKEKVISISSLETQKNSLDVAKSKLNLAQYRYQKTKITAPFSGYIGLNNYSIGDYIQTNQVLTTLDNLKSVYVDVDIPQKYIEKITTIDHITLSVNAYDERVFYGKYSEQSQRVDVNNAIISTRFNVDNQENLLKVGMLANVNFSLNLGDTILIPVSAIIYSGLDRYVFLVDEENIAVKKQVILGVRKKNHVAVLSGLNKGDVIVTKGVVKIKEGDIVEY